MRYVCKEEESVWYNQRSGGQQEQRHIPGGEELWHCSVRGGRGDIVRICPTLDSHLRRTFNNTGNEIEDVKKFVGIDYVFVNGFQLLLNRVYDRIGFGQIKEFERIIKLSGIDMSVESTRHRQNDNDNKDKSSPQPIRLHPNTVPD